MLEAIRAAVNATLRKNPAALKCEAIALRMGINPSSLYRWGDTQDQDIPLERLVQLTLFAQDLRPLQALARLCNCAMIPLPIARGTDAQLVAVKAIHAFSAFMEEDAKDLLHTRMTPGEMRLLEAKGQAAMKGIVYVLEAARALMPEEQLDLLDMPAGRGR